MGGGFLHVRGPELHLGLAFDFALGRSLPIKNQPWVAKAQVSLELWEWYGASRGW